MAFLQNKTTTDAAILKFWTECLDNILKSKNLRNYNHLTVFQSFLAIGPLLEDSYGTTDISWEIKFIQDNVINAVNQQPVDPVLWKN